MNGQIEWLNKFMSINLHHWRYEIIDDEPEWFYVGEWSATKIMPHPSKCDGGYSKRKQNLKINKYNYWTTDN
jgi:hypothetical protein